MLRELHISNLAVIADATLELGEGLNVFTGQTGAGKSLVIGAVEALIGLRPAAGMLRSGAAEGRVSGLFELETEGVRQRVAAAVDQELPEGEPVLITRKLFASGRTSVSVNGQPATAAMVRDAAQQLVDIHGQHDHQYLLRPANQLAVIDAFAGCEAVRERFGERWRELRELEQRRDELAASATLRAQQLELYRFQAQEIDAGELEAGELPELEARARVLGHVQRLKAEAGSVQQALYEAEGSAVERLTAMTQVLAELAELDEDLQPVHEQVRTATLTLQESAYELARYTQRLEHDPGEVEQVDQRLNAINRLVHKYSGQLSKLPPPPEDGPGQVGEVPEQAADDAAVVVLVYRAALRRLLESLEGADDASAGMDQQIAALREQLTKIGAELSRARRKAGEKLVPRVEAQLKQLGMGEAKLALRLESVGLDEESAGPTGLDRAVLLAQTNPGQDPQPLREIASGGELSRVMLGLKSVLASDDRVSVLVFDEVDANIGGRLGAVIGRKLRELAGAPGASGGGGRGFAAAAKHEKGKGGKSAGATSGGGGGHQVLCITHLPQIAAFADRHFHVAKAVSGKGKAKQTVTRVDVLEGDRRVEELAEMMAGESATATSRRQAKELLAAAG
jgi:DNA repair protein RecN (Recombination protein N)